MVGFWAVRFLYEVGWPPGDGVLWGTIGVSAVLWVRFWWRKLGEED